MEYDRFSTEEGDIEVADRDIIEHLPLVEGGNFYNALNELKMYKKIYYETGTELGYERELLNILWANIMGEFNEGIS